MSILEILGGLGTLGFATTTVVFVIRNKGLAIDRNDADTARKVAEAALKVGTKEFDDYRDRAEAKEARLVAELERYESQELDGIEKEPDRKVRIRRRRDWVRGVLSKASSPTGDDSDRGVREDAPTEP